MGRTGIEMRFASNGDDSVSAIIKISSKCRGSRYLYISGSLKRMAKKEICPSQSKFSQERPGLYEYVAEVLEASSRLRNKL